MKKVVFLVIIILWQINYVAALQFSEIMYNPTEELGGRFNEWVEIFNEGGNYSLSGCTIDGKKLGDSVIKENSFFIIARNKTKFRKYFSVDVEIIEKKIVLNNKEDTIKLEGSCSASFTYNKEMGANGNGYTLERRSDGSWGESLRIKGTPGKNNSINDFASEFSSLIISEVMPDPFGDDDENKPEGEWIELFNEGKKDLDLRGLKIIDEKKENELYVSDTKVLDGTIICAGCYKIIYRDGDSDFALDSRGYEEVSLISNGKKFTHMSYSGSTEGMSWSNINDKWFLTPPTAGEENKYVEGCDWKIDLDINETIARKDAFAFSVRVKRKYGASGNVTVKGIIQDYYGRIKKIYRPWTNSPITSLATKKYSPNLPEGIYSMKFMLSGLKCSEKNLQDNTVTRTIAINPRYKMNASSLEINKIYLGSDNKAEWGDQIRVNVNIYKGDETKKSIQLWAEREGEKISKTTKISINSAYKEYPLVLPLQLEANCNEKIPEGKVTLVLEGFNLHVESSFLVEGVDTEICRDYLTYVKEDEKQRVQERKEDRANQIVEFPISIRAGDVLPVKVQIVNSGKRHEYSMWSYLYRGSKCYSCANEERDTNMQRIIMNNDEVEVIEFLLKIPEDLDGEYKVKVKIKKDKQKTIKELTRNIYVNKMMKKVNKTLNTQATRGYNFNEEEVQQPLAEKINKVNLENKDYPGIIVFESSSQKAKKLIPTLLAITFAILAGVLAFQKK